MLSKMQNLDSLFGEGKKGKIRNSKEKLGKKRKTRKLSPIQTKCRIHKAFLGDEKKGNIWKGKENLGKVRRN